jgi:hypothetical protein
MRYTRRPAPILRFLACARPGENLQRGRQQPIKGTRLDGEAWGKRVAEIGRHCREDRALNVTVAVEERRASTHAAQSATCKKERRLRATCASIPDSRGDRLSATGKTAARKGALPSEEPLRCFDGTGEAAISLSCEARRSTIREPPRLSQGRYYFYIKMRRRQARFPIPRAPSPCERRGL